MKTRHQHLLVTSSQRRAKTSGVDDFFATNGVDLVLVLARSCLGILAVKFDEAQSCHSAWERARRALHQGPHVLPRVHHRSLGVLAISPVSAGCVQLSASSQNN